MFGKNTLARPKQGMQEYFATLQIRQVDNKMYQKSSQESCPPTTV